MTTITMLDLRKRSRELIQRLERGETFTITYRNRPVAELRPLASEAEWDADDPVYQIARHAEDLGGLLSAEDADRLLYGK